MNKKGNILVLIITTIAILGIAVGGYFVWQKSQPVKPLTWETCIKTKDAILQTSYPGKCVLPDGRSITQPLSDDEKKSLQPPINTTTSTKTYIDTKYNFKIDVPANWTYQIYPANNDHPYEIIFDPQSKIPLPLPVISVKENWSIDQEIESVKNGNTLIPDNVHNLRETTVGNIRGKQFTYGTQVGVSPTEKVIEYNNLVLMFFFNYNENDTKYDQILSTFKFL